MVLFSNSCSEINSVLLQNVVDSMKTIKPSYFITILESSVGIKYILKWDKNWVMNYSCYKCQGATLDITLICAYYSNYAHLGVSLRPGVTILRKVFLRRMFSVWNQLSYCLKRFTTKPLALYPPNSIHLNDRLNWPTNGLTEGWVDKQIE